MTVYAKIENNKLITAYNGYNGIIGLADSAELCEANGFTAYTEDEISGYYAGTYKIIDGALVDISTSQEYISTQKDLLLEGASDEYIAKKNELLPVWTQQFVNSLSGCLGAGDIRARVAEFKVKTSGLLNDYLTKTEEINNG